MMSCRGQFAFIDAGRRNPDVAAFVFDRQIAAAEVVIPL